MLTRNNTSSKGKNFGSVSDAHWDSVLEMISGRCYSPGLYYSLKE
jgi:hypothetical protein